MEELGKALINALKDAPHLALSALVIFYGFKVAVVGSIYGVIRFCVDRVCKVLETRKTEYKEIRPIINGMCITSDGTSDELIAQLQRLRGLRTGISSNYIHKCGVQWLQEAIDEKLEKERGGEK